MGSDVNIALVSPYHSGSHKSWAEGYAADSKHTITIYSLPGRYWKWRMHGAAISLAKRVANNPAPDRIIVTDMVDLPLFLSLLPSSHRVKTMLYMHENQFDYPLSPDDSDAAAGRDFHYGFINIASALVADTVIFNSHYHKDSFIEKGVAFFRSMPDDKDVSSMESIAQKSVVIYPGIEIPEQVAQKEKSEKPTILWNHRHEYDKNPKLFFSTLFRLKEEGHVFSLIILGERGRNEPKIFDDARGKLKDEIVFDAYAESKEEYLSLLSRADIMPVTSVQELFGISVLEAASHGVELILPEKLTYPELFSSEEFAECFYRNEEELYQITLRCLKSRSISEKFISAAKRFERQKWSGKLDNL